MSDQDLYWYKDAIIYQLHIKAFFDANNDGIGDFKGLTEKLDYLQDLGVNTIWVLPFYPSPGRDDGYDISDYRNINPAYGTMRDFRNFIREAHDRGLRVVTELVINHTSDQHAWFQRARRAKPGSAWRNYYVWSDTDQRYLDTRIIFCDTEASNWAWDPVAQQYYWHRFFHHQPDLNFDNPRVFDEVVRVMKYWLDMGVDGLRLDAIPYLVEREGTNNENLPETHSVLKRLRAWLDEHYDDRFFLAEANQWPEDVRAYFGEADECHMAFHFPLMPRMYMALAQEDRHPITDIMNQTPDIPEGCQWAVFLRNHDELTLEMVTDRERDYLWSFYAADPRARINLGIRRRLAPLLENDRRKIELLNSLLMSMPGTPIIYYGDELGMGDNIFLGDRNGVRTPMQWSPDRSGGFSRADPAQLYLPAIMDPVYGFQAINVEAQTRSPTSLLNWMKRLINVRKQHMAFGRGALRFLYPGNGKILAYLRQYNGDTILCVANLSRSPQPLELDLSEFRGRVPVELFHNIGFPAVGDLPYFLTLPAYGFYWFLLAEKAESPTWHEPILTTRREVITLVISRSVGDLGQGRARDALERQVLPFFLPDQRWFAAKGRRIATTHLDWYRPLAHGGQTWLLTTFRVDLADGGSQRYFMPLAVAWESRAQDPMTRLDSTLVARVRQSNRTGVLYDGMADRDLALTLLEYMRTSVCLPGEDDSGERLAFTPGDGLHDRQLSDNPHVQRLGGEQSNTTLLIDEQMILKIYRRLQDGVHPEIEIGRFLTEEVPYANTPNVLGTLERVGTDGATTALGILHAFIPNQGDAWTYTREHLARLLEDADLAADNLAGQVEEQHTYHRRLMTVLGRRVAELHRAFAAGTSPAFVPEPVTAEDLAAWRQALLDQGAQARRALEAARPDLPEDLVAAVDALLERLLTLGDHVDARLPARLDTVKIRCHGDLHLGQVIVALDDVHILDFEGEPARDLDERRARHVPLKDVAGMLRSFNYAAWAARFDTAAARPHQADLLGDWLARWESDTAEAFLEGYEAAIGDCPTHPADGPTRRNLLDLFVLEKALYEIGYEAANRPNWLRVPLAGLEQLFAREDAGDD